MEFFNGKFEAKLQEKEITKRLSKINDVPTLGIIQIGKNESSEKYINLKIKLCKKLGILVKTLYLNYPYGENKILDKKTEKEIKVNLKNANLAVMTKVAKFLSYSVMGGVLIQLPLPHNNIKPVLDLIPLKKDIDLLSTSAKHRFYVDNDFSHLSPVNRSLNHFISYYDKDISNLSVIVVGEGELVGKPLAHYLKSNGAKVNVVNNYSKGTKLDAELVVLSAGIPNLISGEDIVKNAYVVDFGSSIVDNKVCGDLNLSSKLKHLRAVSPSPGGMGPLTVRYLLLNLQDLTSAG